MPGPAGQMRSPARSWATSRPAASKASDVGRSGLWGVPGGPGPRGPRPSRGRPGGPPLADGLVSTPAERGAEAAGGPATGPVADARGAGPDRPVDDSGSFAAARGTFRPDSGHRPFRQVQTPPSTPPPARTPSGPKARDDNLASNPLSCARAAESWIVQIEVDPVRPTTARVR